MLANLLLPFTHKKKHIPSHSPEAGGKLRPAIWAPTDNIKKDQFSCEALFRVNSDQTFVLNHIISGLLQIQIFGKNCVVWKSMNKINKNQMVSFMIANALLSPPKWKFNFFKLKTDVITMKLIWNGHFQFFFKFSKRQCADETLKLNCTLEFYVWISSWLQLWN